MQRLKKILGLLELQKGQSLIELLMAIGLMAILIPALSMGFVATRNGRPQEQQRIQAIAALKETEEAVRSIREKGWVSFATNGTFHPVLSGSGWSFASGAATTNGFTKQVIIADVYRNNGAIASSGGSLDPSTKKATVSISWTQPYVATISAVLYMTRYLDNLTYFNTTQADFNSGTKGGVDITNIAGGEIQLTTNNKAKWCSPSFSSSTIDLPDGPPVAVSAKSYGASSTPNDVFAAVAPFATTSAKLAYVQVTANTDPPVSSLKGTFTMDSAKYSVGTFPTPVPSPNTLDNSFKTNDVKYYQSPSGKTYALLATDLPTKEVVVAQINNGAGDAYEDSVNKIYKYWTFFNTSIYGYGTGLDTGYVNPTANSAETTNAGDNNGFATSPTNAYTDNSSFAVDTNSGSGTSTNCTGTDKDKHRFYNYGFSLPASGATIDGITVRLDAKVDNTTGAPKMCVQLSWDGGTSWTTAQSTSTLTTGEVTYTLGGAADTWGHTWTTSNLSNANFRLRVINVASDNTRDFSLDWAAVKVHYSGGTSGTNDQAPFGYGATSLTVLGNRGYVTSGGYLYVFDLTNIDSKSPTVGLDQVGCRIEIDGFDCQPGNGTDRKYSSGETGTSWSSTAGPAHPDTCADGGNIELYADNDIYGVTAGGNDYIFVAVGAGTNPEFNIVNATSVPTLSSSPTLNNNSCGRISGGNASWKMVGSKDFNSNNGTEEAANSVYANATATRAYISSNGTADSKQFYILNTTDKANPKFLNEPPAPTPGTATAGSGYYQSSGANGEMYPRRSLTVLNGQRVVLVGKDGVTNGNNAEEYQVLNSETETSPTYCGGLDFNSGFNDLTSVIEADADTFVYMVANTTVNELKIIQGGPDGTYSDSGTFISSLLDADYNHAFNRFSASVTTPANTSIGWQMAIANAVNGSCSGATYDFRGPGGTSVSTDLYTATGSAILLGTYGSYTNPGRCFKYKAFFSTTDYNATPVVNDVTVNYSP